MTRYFGVHTLEGEWHALLPRYVLLADRVQGKRILDIGCGTGIGSSLLCEMGAEQVNAIDHRPAVLELARLKHAKDGLDFHVMFWEELDFPEHSFDMVLCMDPSSPVTDPSLLLEIKRVLKPGGEYICAIERRNIDGVEALLPRYGYNEAVESIELNRSGERVPQLGQLGQFFETIVPIVQRPQYGYVFDFGEAKDDSEQKALRKLSQGTDESGLWIGDDPQKEPQEHTDQKPGRWITTDDSLCAGEGDPAAVEVLFCGDSHMPPPMLREVRMPFVSLVARLNDLFADLRLHQHPDQQRVQFDDVVDRGFDDDPPTTAFSAREKTSEFRVPTRSAEIQPSAPGLHHIQHQLEEMTRLYQQVRSEMETLFNQTRQELVERDRYIERLVDTVHQWQHKIYLEEGSEALEDNASHRAPEFDEEPTQIFSRESIEEPDKIPEEPADPSEPTETPAATGVELNLHSEGGGEADLDDADDQDDAASGVGDGDSSEEEKGS